MERELSGARRRLGRLALAAGVALAFAGLLVLAAGLWLERLSGR